MSAAGDDPTPIDKVIARVQQVYGSWGRDTTVAQMRADWDNMFWSEAFPARMSPAAIDGVDATWIDPEGVAANRVLVYFHGGGFRVGSVRSHRDLIARIAAGAGCRALGVDYRRVPEHRFPAPLDDALLAYKGLLAQGFAPGSIVLGGDSAGGNIVLALLLRLRDGGLPLPASAFLLSGWTDLTARGESYTTRSAADPIHQRKMILAVAKGYLGDADPGNPLCSPLFADLRGLPPLLLQVGDRETVLDDSRDFAAKARAAGVEVELEVWDGMIHVFQQFTVELPQAATAIASIARFLAAHWQSTSTGEASPS